MLQAYEFEKELGIEFFASHSYPLLGVIKQSAEDFIVEEILRDGTILDVNGNFKFRLPNKGKYLYVAIKKRNITTSDVMIALMQKFKLKFSDIGVYGIKDRRAIAVQCFTLKNVVEKDVKDLKLRKVKPLACSLGYGPARLGQHLGNNFKVVIRNVPLQKDKVVEVLEEFKKVSFIPNYFGYQRFGMPRPVTHKIGESIIKGDYEKAINYLVGFIDPLEPEDHIFARKIFMDTNDPAETLKYLPESLLYERMVLEYLLHHPKDYSGAISKLPAGALRLFIEAYSSYLFNRFLSSRLRAKLLSLEEGDLVSPLDYGLPVFYAFRVGTDIDKQRARELVEKNKLALVLPVMGYRAKLSGGVMGDMEREELVKDGIRPSDFKLWLGDKFVGLKGSYRRLDLKLLDELKYDLLEDQITGSYILSVKFALYRGSYATTYLREIMKQPFAGSYFGKSFRGS
ncbi:MAG TPA: tRNA pseudouridine(13) synthase TruD [Geobacterales bacterium]|nr:tRNA pseudouridine(13) synthase TruD [Geobacterales bacterium]